MSDTPEKRGPQSIIWNHPTPLGGPGPYSTATAVNALMPGPSGAPSNISASGFFPNAMPTGPAAPSDKFLFVTGPQQTMERENKIHVLESELSDLKGQYLLALEEKRKADSEVEKARAAGKERLETEIQRSRTLENNLHELQKKLADAENLKHLAKSIKPEALGLLKEDPRFAELFKDRPCSAFILSVDIRKSTTLMLKARDPQLFAAFITNLCERLYTAVLDNYGIFDKFTGDGVLAFFPDFYTGEDAGFWAVKTAVACHSIFKEEFFKHRNCFTSVPSEAGLGIGIDFGQVNLVSLWGGITVVGAPVVYACRMGTAPSGVTLLNQPAYEQVMEKYSRFCTLREDTIEVKGEGKLIAYAVGPGTKSYEPIVPDWLKLIDAYSKAAPGMSHTVSSYEKKLPVVAAEE